MANTPLNRISKPVKSACLSLLVPVILIFSTPQVSSAYDNDTHFWLTYYIAIKADYTETQATQVASANVGVDFDEDTEPLTPRLDNWRDWLHRWGHYQNIRAQFHALPWTSDVFGKEPTTADVANIEWWSPIKLEDNAKDAEAMAKARELVAARKKVFWEETLTEGKNPGLFLHYLQDTFAHEGFTSYIGHAGYYYVDFLDSDRDKAERMAFETLKYLIVFREAHLKTEKRQGDFPAPETLKIEDLVSKGLVSQETILQIKKSVEIFCKANPSLAGIHPNPLVTHWKKSKDKLAFVLPSKPLIYLYRILQIQRRGPVPDSGKARKAVQELLNISEGQLPHMWVYNFNSAGKPLKGEQAEKAFVYAPYAKSPKCLFTSKDETKNTKKREIKVNSKKQCLAFKLEGKNSQTDPFSCQ